jgi:hypothetical protein
MNSTPAKQLTDRRMNREEQIRYYAHQAKLARLGLSTRRSEEFLLRQIWFLMSEGAR